MLDQVSSCRRNASLLFFSLFFLFFFFFLHLASCLCGTNYRNGFAANKRVSDSAGPGSSSSSTMQTGNWRERSLTSLGTAIISCSSRPSTGVENREASRFGTLTRSSRYLAPRLPAAASGHDARNPSTTAPVNSGLLQMESKGEAFLSLSLSPRSPPSQLLCYEKKLPPLAGYFPRLCAASWLSLALDPVSTPCLGGGAAMAFFFFSRRGATLRREHAAIGSGLSFFPLSPRRRGLGELIFESHNVLATDNEVEIFRYCPKEKEKKRKKK